MKKAFLIAMFVATSAYAGMEKSPVDMYPMTNLMVSSTKVELVLVPNINKTCEEESQRRGLGGFKGVQVEACSFWKRGIINNSCTIYINPRTNNDILGHELHHCFVGNFH